jgi:rhodanese-related sulfurtransferase
MKKILFILILIKAQSISAQNTAFKKVLDEHINQTVPLITVDSLKKNFSNYTILDAREKNEFEVSHIKNAIFVGYENFRISKISNKISKKTPIVIYCSIGYRSEKIAENIQKEGYQVYNLYGGIFLWANEGNEVVNTNNESTKKIHGYNKDWGKWLINSEVVYEK